MAGKRKVKPVEASSPEARVEARGVYRVGAEHNALIPPSDDFAGRLRAQGDWVLFVGMGQYIVLRVHGFRVTGLPAYRFHAKPMGIPIRWKPTEEEFYLLQAGVSIESAVNLNTLMPPLPVDLGSLQDAPYADHDNGMSRVSEATSEG